MTSMSKSFKELDEIDKPAALVSLIFVNRAKTQLPGLEKFKNLVRFKQIELDLSGNLLTEAVHEVLLLKYLKKLNLSKNSIFRLWELPTSIEQLNLSENQISSCELVLPGLVKLQSLNISSNLLTSIKPLSSLTRLKTLNASSNQLESTSGLESCKDLIDLNLESNNIRSLTAFLSETSVCLFNLKNNPCTTEAPSIDTALLEQLGFFMQDEGVYVRNAAEAKAYLKSKLSGRKSKREEKKKPGPSFRSRNTSMQEIYDQVINEDPEMEESFNQSESEENFTHSEEQAKKTVPVAKLQLEKILDKQNDKVSAEKWSTKPESVEMMLEDFIQFCGLNELSHKGSSSEKYESVFRVLKQREEERKSIKKAYDELLILSRELKDQVSQLQVGQREQDGLIECLRDENSKVQYEVVSLRRNNIDLNSCLHDLKLSFEQNEEKLVERIRTLEDERNSSRFNFSYSCESEPSLMTDYNDIEMRSFVNNNQVLVPVEVGEYIQKLLSKISSLVTKNKKLRVQIDKYRCLLNSKPKN